MNLPTMVASRQRADPMPLVGLPVSGLLAAAANVETRPVRATGTDAVVGLVISDVAGQVLVLGAPAVVRGNRTRPGSFVRLAGPIATSLDPESGRQVAILDEQVRADFIKVRFTNGASKQALFEASFSLVPIYPYKRVVIQAGPGGGAGSGSAGAAAPVAVAGAPGANITTPADTPIAAAATEPLPVPPAGTRRMRVQVTGGDATTRVRVREVGAGAGRGTLLDLLGSTMYGGADGAIAALEAQNVAGPAAAIAVQFERD